MKKGEPRKKVIAWAMQKKTSVRNEWIARLVETGCASNLSQTVREVDESEEGVLFELKKILK